MTDPAYSSMVQFGAATGNANPGVSLSGLGTINAGDVLIAICVSVAPSSSITWTKAAGGLAFTKYFENTAAADAFAVFAYTCDGTESGTQTFTRSATVGNAILSIIKCTNVDPLNPVDSCGVAAGTTTTIVLPSLTPSTAQSLSLQFGAVQPVQNPTWTSPSGVTINFQGTATGQAVGFAIGTEVLTSTAATGTQTWTKSISGAGKGIHIILNPLIVVPVIPLTSVMIDGVEKSIASVVVMVDGVEKVVASAVVMVAGVEKPSSH